MLTENDRCIVSEFVTKFGPQFKDIASDALVFLNEKESKWGVVMNRKKYLAGIIEGISHYGESKTKPT